ncbi:tRNA isopentenyl-2-thiomethyl-A-37 hydroxylase MiaE [Congregibacter sp.]|nr:tRNA isopentenyl-2-thiomethyl-A-37 hydroxylase MiaE [Congregibacter sp.]MDA8961885.1 tRNA isopentenyl-2-thiomethyl-A-37 hydroxylase MiaE [Congregibacter sp.]
MTAAIVSGVDMSPIRNFLLCDTPQAWIEAASAEENLHTLLIDHANCEKKAASTALQLMYRYVEHPSLLHKLSRLAREELRHFEQVLAMIEKRGMAYPQLSAARYAAGLRDKVDKNEPYRLLDTLLVGAIIEARSCERFAAVLPVLDDELTRFYGSLLRSESRHFMDYLSLARELLPSADIDARLRPLLEAERALIQSEDPEFRFHSGVPQ